MGIGMGQDWDGDGDGDVDGDGDGDGHGDGDGMRVQWDATGSADLTRVVALTSPDVALARTFTVAEVRSTPCSGFHLHDWLCASRLPTCKNGRNLHTPKVRADLADQVLVGGIQ